MSLIIKFRWYGQRLASMSPAEILHRLKEAARRRSDRRKAFNVDMPEDQGLLPFIPGLRESLSRWQVPDVLLNEWRDNLQQARSGRFRLLGITWPECERDRRWHFDPVTSTYWPADRYCFDIDYRHAGDKGDIKYAWELGRLQYLQPVAALAFLRKDTDTARFALAEIERWIDHNPPYLGVHWASGIELALRTVSILTVLTLAGEFITKTQHAKILKVLYAHACWLERYPSLYSSENNHRAAEGLGLFLIGALCPRMQGADRFREHGWAILCESAQRLILNDGTGAEQAVSYAGFTAEMLLLGLRVAQSLEMDVPVAYTQRLALTGEFLRWLTDAGGSQPMIGDDDGGRVIGPGADGEQHVTSVLASIAATLNRPDLTPPKTKPHLREAFFGFPPPAAESPQGLRSFPEGGYTALRHLDRLLVFDHGPLGYLSIAAHGHADALAIWLHIGDAPVLVDAGTHLYHAGGEWRRHFRSTKAHNTLCLEGADSSIMAGNFNWSHKAHVYLTLSEKTGPEGYRIEAQHDGYRGRFGAIHRRRLDVEVGGFTVTDSIAAGKPHNVSINFLLHPGLQATVKDAGIHITRENRPTLHIAHEGPLLAGLEPAEYSPCFGVKQAATRITFAGTLAPGQHAATRFTYV